MHTGAKSATQAGCLVELLGLIDLIYAVNIFSDVQISQPQPLFLLRRIMLRVVAKKSGENICITACRILSSGCH